MLTEQEINIIKANFSIIRITNKQIDIFKQKYYDLFLKIENIIKLNSNYESVKNFIYLIIHNKKLEYCHTCGKQLTFKQTIIKKQLFCSYKCSNINNELKNIRLKHTKQTCLKTFNVDSYSKIKEVNNKKRETFLKHYNTKEKINQLQEKRKLASQIKYNTNYPQQSNVVKEKLKIAMKNVDYNKRKEKSELTSLQKFGFTHKQIALSYQNILKLKNVKPLFTKEEFKGKNKIYKFQCLLCGNIFDGIYDNGYLIKKCKCQCLTNTSQMERDLADFCRQYFPKLLSNNKDFIKPKEVDILIPEIKLAIEFNGLYWHCLENKPVGYHLNKTELVESKGYRLIQIWQQDWIFKQDEIKSHLVEIFENREIIPTDIEYLDRDWYVAPKNVEIIKPEIEQIDFINNLSIQFQRTGYFKNPNFIKKDL